MWLLTLLNTELAACCCIDDEGGAYALIRFFTLIFNHHSGITHPLLVACLTMIIGALGVIAYKDIKKIAAYQVILSIGFIILGLGSSIRR